MIVVGAKGFAKEIFEDIVLSESENNIAFYDDISDDNMNTVYGKYPILKNPVQAKSFLNQNSLQFTLGLGNPHLRKKMLDFFEELNGEVVGTYSKQAKISEHEVTIGKGTNILAGAKISNSVEVGICSIIYYNVLITHDCKVGNFVELSPGATLLGRVHIGDFVHVGANATILPDVQIGENAIIGAGSVVTKNVPPNTTVVGVPGKTIKDINE